MDNVGLESFPGGHRVLKDAELMSFLECASWQGSEMSNLSLPCRQMAVVELGSMAAGSRSETVTGRLFSSSFFLRMLDGIHEE